MNQDLLDSHDVDRAASMFVNPDLPFNGAERIQDHHPTYSPRKPDAAERQRMLQEVAFQMTFVGAPMVYYGDEAGMWGAGDPSDRQPMLWQDLQPYADPDVTFDAGKFDWYQRLIAVHRKLPALQTGFLPAAGDRRRGRHVRLRPGPGRPARLRGAEPFRPTGHGGRARRERRRDRLAGPRTPSTITPTADRPDATPTAAARPLPVDQRHGPGPTAGLRLGRARPRHNL